MDFTIHCTACFAKVDFNADQVEGMQDYLAREIKEEIDDNRLDAEDKYDEGFRDGEESVGYVPPAAVESPHRPFRELSIAIRRGDKGEAERLLDLIANEISDRAYEDVQQGRFSPEAKVPA